MALIVQAITINEKIIEGARWEIESQSFFQRGQKVTVELPVRDPQLLGYMSKHMNNDCILDADNGNYSVIMSCVVTEVRHMIHISSKTVDTVVIVQAQNKLVEHTLQFLLQPNHCDPRFIRAVRGDAR